MFLTLYEHTTPKFLEDFLRTFQRRNCIFYASEIFKDGQFLHEIPINCAVERAKYACAALKMPISEHFVSVYRAINDEIYVDWKLSSFAAFLTVLNGDPSDPMVAMFQKALYKEMQ